MSAIGITADKVRAPALTSLVANDPKRTSRASGRYFTIWPRISPPLLAAVGR